MIEQILGVIGSKQSAAAAADEANKKAIALTNERLKEFFRPFLQILDAVADLPSKDYAVHSQAKVPMHRHYLKSDTSVAFTSWQSTVCNLRAVMKETGPQICYLPYGGVGSEKIISQAEGLEHMLDHLAKTIILKDVDLPAYIRDHRPLDYKGHALVFKASGGQVASKATCQRCSASGDLLETPCAELLAVRIANLEAQLQG